MNKDFIKQYAKAVFEVADDLESKANYLEEIRSVDSSLSNDKDIANFFNSVDVTTDQKLKVVESVLSKSGVSKEVLNLVKLLVERKKIKYFPEIALAYRNLNDSANGVVRGSVRSANDLTEDQRKSITSKIEDVLSKKVILEYIKDAKVIGGLKAQVGSYTFDDTFESHLRKMKDQINRRTH